MNLKPQMIFVAAIALIVGVVFGVVIVMTRQEVPPTQPMVMMPVTTSTAESVARQPAVPEKKPELPQDLIDFSAFQATPNVSDFTIASTTFVVVSWISQHESAGGISVYFSRATEERIDFGHPWTHLFSDLASSCNAPFEYGVRDGYFFIKRQLSPCEAFSIQTEWWFDETGKQIAYYKRDSSLSEMQFAVAEGPARSIKVKFSGACGDTEWKADSRVPSIEFRGMEINGNVIPPPTVDRIACWESYGGGYWENPRFNIIQTTGTEMMLELPNRERVTFDIRSPQRITWLGKRPATQWEEEQEGKMEK